MNIVLFANSSFALNPFKKLLSTNYSIKYVVTNTDKPSGRKKILKSTPVAQFANENNLNLLKIENFNDISFIDKLKNANADVFIIIAYRILPKTIYNIPKFGSINMHASYLPEYPGASPIQRSIINGEKELGLTTFFLNEQIDKGDIILRERYKINDKITYGDAYKHLSLKASKLLLNTLKSLTTIKPIQQNGDIIEYAKKIKSEEYKISLNNDSVSIHNLFRGLTPPAPYLLFNNKKIKLFNTYYISNCENSYKIGQYYVENNILHIQCKSGLLLAESVQFEGKNNITIDDFNNMNIDPSSLFE